MLYLLFRITVFLVAAACLGFGVGWFVRQVRSEKREADIQKQLNTARSRVPLLESRLKDREMDCERHKQSLVDGENRFVQAGALIEKRDRELVELERKIIRLNNSLDTLESIPADWENPSQSFVAPQEYADMEPEQSEQKKLLSQLESRLDIQDQLIREAETSAQAKAAALVSMESSHSQQMNTLEEMLAEEQLRVVDYVSSQNEAHENLRRLTDEVSELRSAESQHESEMTIFAEELEQGRRLELKLEQDLKQSQKAQYTLEQDLASAYEADPHLAELEEALVKLQSRSDSQEQLSKQEIATVQAKLVERNETLSVLKTRNAGLEEQLTRSRQAQLKLASGYNEGMEARKQLEDAKKTEACLVQRLRILEQTNETLEPTSVTVEPAVLYQQLPAHIDNLKQIRGLGVAAEKQLNSVGIYHFQQIADFDSSNVDWIEKQLKKLKGRFKRDNWIAQATHLQKSVPRIHNTDSTFH